MKWRGWSAAVSLALAGMGCNAGYYVGPAGDDGEPIEPDPPADDGAPGVPADGDAGASDADTGDDGTDEGVKFDVAVTPAPAIPHELIVYVGAASGGFTLAARYPIGDDVTALAALPLADDGGDDLVVAAATGGRPELRRFAKPAQNGGFNDTPVERFDALGIGDVDADGNADVLLADARWVWAYRAVGSSLVLDDMGQRALPDDQADARAVAVADLASDGAPDVIVAAGWEAEACGGRPLSLAVIDDYYTEQYATTQTEYGSVAAGGVTAQIDVAELGGDGFVDVVLASEAGDVLEFAGAGSVFAKPITLDTDVERVALRPRPTHGAFDLVRYQSPSLAAARVQSSALVDVASTDAFARPARLAPFDGRPAVAMVTEARDRVVVLDVSGDELVEAASLVPTVTGDDVIIDLVIGDFDGDGFEDLGLSVASATALDDVPTDPFGGECPSP